MKIETRNQLVGVLIGTVIGVGINQLPGISEVAKLWVIVGTVLVVSSILRFLRKKYKGSVPGLI